MSGIKGNTSCIFPEYFLCIPSLKGKVSFHIILVKGANPQIRSSSLLYGRLVVKFSKLMYSDGWAIGLAVVVQDRFIFIFKRALEDICCHIHDIVIQEYFFTVSILN